jgi:4'-phosphopantetheinyl transferase
VSTITWLAPAYGSEPPVLEADELHIWRADLDIGHAAQQALAAYLHADERSRADRFVFPHDRARFVVARGLLRYVLGMYLHVQPSDLHFGYTPYGKPFLAAPEAGAWLAFNVSHSQSVALYALAQDRQVGVDLEYMRQDLDYSAMLSGIFTGREQRVLASLPEYQRRLAFFRGWVRKEAYVKARGEGLSIAPDSFEVSLLANESAALYLQSSDQPWSLHTLEPGEGYMGAVVVEGAVQQLRYYTLKLNRT